MWSFNKSKISQEQEKSEDDLINESRTDQQLMNDYIKYGDAFVDLSGENKEDPF